MAARQALVWLVAGGMRISPESMSVVTQGFHFFVVTRFTPPETDHCYPVEPVIRIRKAEEIYQAGQCITKKYIGLSCNLRNSCQNVPKTQCR